jgi:hypothetical protein
MSDEELDVQKELAAENTKMAVDISGVSLPLEVQVRSVALTLAVRHCGDTVVSEGNLYQQLKMDGKLGGPLTVDHVINCARLFEAFLWGKWSKGVAAEVIEKTIKDAEDIINEELDRKFDSETEGKPE